MLAGQKRLISVQRIDQISTILAHHHIMLRDLEVPSRLKRGSFRGSPRFAVPLWAALMLSLIGAAISTPGHAKVGIEGDVTDLRVTASEDTISDILAVVSTAFNLRYRTSIPLETRISGTYSGSATRVIARLLRDYNFNFVIGHKDEMIEVLVFGNGLSGKILQNAPPDPILAPNPTAVLDIASAQSPAPLLMFNRHRDTHYEHFRLSPTGPSITR
jgi:hypothetical protein